MSDNSLWKSEKKKIYQMIIRGCYRSTASFSTNSALFSFSIRDYNMFPNILCLIKLNQTLDKCGV